jgi:hypothetical protein
MRSYLDSNSFAKLYNFVKSSIFVKPLNYVTAIETELKFKGLGKGLLFYEALVLASLDILEGEGLGGCLPDAVEVGCLSFYYFAPPAFSFCRLPYGFGLFFESLVSYCKTFDFSLI